MKIVEIRKQTAKKLVLPWIEKIAQSDWRAGKYLAQLLTEEKFFDLCGAASIVYLLTDDNENLISFCSFNEKDDIPNTDLTPWIGFVYTFPQYRGKHYMGKLIETACQEAKNRGQKTIYVSTHDEGIYEKYGFSFCGVIRLANLEPRQAYMKTLEM